MFKRVPDQATGPIQQRNEARLAGQIGSKHERVDEQANEIFSLDLISPGDLRADRDICGVGIPMQ